MRAKAKSSPKVGTKGSELVGKKTEMVKISDLTPHPRNYRKHPEDQLLHIGNSLKQHGFYRNVVIAKDGTILAGHGVVQAAKLVGIDSVPVFRLNIKSTSSAAMKILIGDNELPRFAETDDRALTELLKEIKEGEGLLGTGYDEQMLAGLLMITRPSSEIANLNEAAEWVGMPEYTSGEPPIQLVITFVAQEERERFIKLVKKFDPEWRINQAATGRKTWATRWPNIAMEDVAGARFVGGSK